MSIIATYALFHRTAAEKNFTPGEWIDSGLRGDDPKKLKDDFAARHGLDWQDIEYRLVPFEPVDTDGVPTESTDWKTRALDWERRCKLVQAELKQTKIQLADLELRAKGDSDAQRG